MAEWSIAIVLKTIRLKGLQGSNPCLSAIENFMTWKVINVFNSRERESKFMPLRVNPCLSAILACRLLINLINKKHFTITSRLWYKFRALNNKMERYPSGSRGLTANELEV
jgi:hypothetical protein